MSLLIFLFVIVIVYVASFNNDFTKDKIDKAMPFLVIVGLIIIVIGAIASF